MLTLPPGHHLTPQGFRPLHDALLPVLNAIEDDLLDTPSPRDHLHTLYAAGGLEQTLLGGHLTLLGVRLVLTEQVPGEIFDLTCDLALTFHTQHPAGGALSHALSDLARVGRPYDPVRLLPGELHHAAALLLDEATRLGVPVLPSLQEGGLAWTLITRPAHARNPVMPDPHNLRPHPTGVPERQAREAELLALQDTAPSLHEAYAALLLLHVNARDRQANMPVLLLLELTATLLISARDLHAEQGTSGAGAQALHAHLFALHADLGRPRLRSLRPGHVVTRAGRDAALRYARHSLRALRRDRLAPPALLQDLRERQLWQMFDRLDARLAEGETPETHPNLRLQLALHSTLALTRTFRAPGMALPPLVELAAQLSGIDPLWAWQETQPSEQGGHPIDQALEHVTNMLVLLAQSAAHPDEPGMAEILRVLRAAAGNLLAVTRRQGLRLPDQAFLEAQFHLLGPLRGSAFTRGEEDDFRHALQELTRQVLAVVLEDEDDGASEPSEASPPATTGQAAPVLEVMDAPPAPTLPAPVHVEAARALLAGRHVTLLGGVPSPTHHAALVRDLGLAGLDWIASADYQHGTHAAAHVGPDTAVVILAVRWMGHAHNALREVARARGVPFVMHPGGLNPSSVAYQVLRQVSGQLRAGA